MLREGGGLVEPRTRRRSPALRGAELGHLPGQRRLRADHAQRRGRRSRNVVGLGAAPGRPSRRDRLGGRERLGSGQAHAAATVSPSASNGDVTGFVILTHGTDTRRIPFWVEVDHPRLAREHAVTLTHPGIYRATTVGGASLVSHYRYPTAGDSAYPGPEVAYLVHVTKPVANFGVAVLSGRAIPHVVFAGDENHLVGFPGLPHRHQPVPQHVRRGSTGRRCDPARHRDVRDRLRHALGRARGPVHVPLLDERHDAAEAPHPLDRARQITVSVTDSGAGVDPESITATLDGHSVIERFQRRAADVRDLTRAPPGDHHRVRLPGAEEHGGRGADQTEHRHAPPHGRRTRLAQPGESYRASRTGLAPGGS